MATNWLTAEPRVLADGRTVLVNTFTCGLLADLDPATGALSLDTTFKDRGAARPGVSLGRAVWPHGATGAAIPHGAVFARP